MKKGLIFSLGIVTGCVLTIVGLLVIGNSCSEKSRITYASQEIEFKGSDSFKVFQVLKDGALADCDGYSFETVYIIAEGQNLFYDHQIVKVPNGKRAMQIGTFRYNSVALGERCVPVIRFQ